MTESTPAVLKLEGVTKRYRGAAVKRTPACEGVPPCQPNDSPRFVLVRRPTPAGAP